MPNRLISTISFFMLTVFFFNVCVFGVLLSAELTVHQQEQKDKIKNKRPKEIIELRISRELVEKTNAEFQWVKNWEFRWHGEMYDIEKSVVTDDEYVFSVKHDSEEDMLRKKIERNAQDQQNSRNEQSRKNLKCGSEFFEIVDFKILLSEQVIDRSWCSFTVATAGFGPCPDPPPWMV